MCELSDDCFRKHPGCACACVLLGIVVVIVVVILKLTGYICDLHHLSNCDYYEKDVDITPVSPQASIFNFILDENPDKTWAILALILVILVAIRVVCRKKSDGYHDVEALKENKVSAGNEKEPFVGSA